MALRLPAAPLAARMPPAPEPPHDPTSVLLAGWVGPDARGGFRAAVLTRVEVGAATQALVLEPTPDAQRRMVEASGSFGGLRPPFNVALGPAGDVYLLDSVSGALMRFDACECRFLRVPCFTRLAEPPASACEAALAPPRRPPPDLLSEPHGIAICGGDVFIADSGHARVSRYAMNGFLARAALSLPRKESQPLPTPWYPFALAVDGHGVLHVSDPRNSRIDSFDARGRWLRVAKTGAPPWLLAVDCADRLHAVVEPLGAIALASPADGQGARWGWSAGSAPQVVRIDETGEHPVAGRADQARDFPAASFAVDARGLMHLPCAGREALFDARGAEPRAESRGLADRYHRAGRYQSLALDARIEGCQWHRVELRGALPPGCGVTVRTTCAHVPLDAGELAGLPDDSWSAPCTATAMDARCSWDCLVASPPGRYLWLRLDFTGNGQSTPCIEAIVVEFPRVSLRRYLPAVFGADPLSADFTDRFTALFDTTLRSIERHMDGIAKLFDPAGTPAGGAPGEPDFLSWLASWIGVAAAREWPEEQRRRYVKEAAGLYSLRGTPQGLWRQLLLLLGLDGAMKRCLAERPRSRCVAVPLNCGPGPRLVPAAAPPLILEHFKLRRWLITGHGRLGDDAVLWGRRIVNRAQLSGDTPPPEQSGNARVGESRLITTPDPLRDPFHVFAHRFSVLVPARVRTREVERRALEQLLAREAPAHTLYDVRYVEPRFRVGVQAMLGLDSVIARTPRGVTLGANTLGQGSVLSAPPARRGGPRLRVGDARVGTGTVLT